jgi:hypothetical protein
MADADIIGWRGAETRGAEGAGPPHLGPPRRFGGLRLDFLAGLALEALDQGHAVLLSNCCALTTGPTLEAALVRARELETLARLYAITLSLGRPYSQMRKSAASANA